MGKLMLVGAGPGDMELITVKGVKALQNADVVLYDALANHALLEYCKPGCHVVYVGKKPGLHWYQQIYINDMIVAYARQYETVVRLKGGDPFVFGRGHEELTYAMEHGIEVEVVPGVTSAIAVPAMLGIPLTKRGVNESFWVVTGTTASGHFSQDMRMAAQSTASVVILMGMKRLPEIIKLFKKYRAEDEPVAVIQNGTCENECKAFGTLQSIVDVVNKKALKAPAIILIGEVVNKRQEQVATTLCYDQAWLDQDPHNSTLRQRWNNREHFGRLQKK